MSHVKDLCGETVLCWQGSLNTAQGLAGCWLVCGDLALVAECQLVLSPFSFSVLENSFYLNPQTILFPVLFCVPLRRGEREHLCSVELLPG